MWESIFQKSFGIYLATSYRVWLKSYHKIWIVFHDKCGKLLSSFVVN